MSSPLLEVEALSVFFTQCRSQVAATRNLTFFMNEGETLAVVGESGCGKTTLGRGILRMLPSTALVTGEIRFRGIELNSLPRDRMAELRGSQISMVFQDPGQSLTPTMTIGSHLAEVIRKYRRAPRSAIRGASLALLTKMGIDDATRVLNSYPHELSGGLQQRVVIGMAVIARPKLLIADEPTRMLDACTQALLLEMLHGFRADGLSTLMITHDLRIARRYSDRLLVMRNGRVEEFGATAEVMTRPASEYTQSLLMASASRSMALLEAN